MNGFDICIPTWNSLEYLKLAVAGIGKHSSVKHNIYVHDNASTDDTRAWCVDEKINLSCSEENLGFAGVNHALRMTTGEHVMLFNSDMVPLPGWDLEIIKQINAFKRKDVSKYTISSCLVEPTGHNPEYDIENFGADAASFDEEKMLKSFKTMRGRYYMRRDTVQYSHPILLPREMFKRIGWLDSEYFPGWAIDHDLAARAYYRADCRDFVMLGKSRVYHFSSKTFQKLPDELRSRHGEDIFLNKWGESVTMFRRKLGVTQPYA